MTGLPELPKGTNGRWECLAQYEADERRAEEQKFMDDLLNPGSFPGKAEDKSAGPTVTASNSNEDEAL